MSKVTDADFAAIAALEKAWSDKPWSETALREFSQNTGAHILVKKDEGALCGYAVFSVCLDYGELLTFAVTPSRRRQGIARALLREVLFAAWEKGADTFTLEVRLSNTPARRLYESCGAVEAGRRKNFYQNPREDALIYSFSRKDEPSP